MTQRSRPAAPTWRTVHGDLTDEEWTLICDLVEPYSSRGKMGAPTRVDRRAIVNAIFYVGAAGCKWRALPACYRRFGFPAGVARLMP